MPSNPLTGQTSAPANAPSQVQAMKPPEKGGTPGIHPAFDFSNPGANATSPLPKTNTAGSSATSPSTTASATPPASSATPAQRSSIFSSDPEVLKSMRSGPNSTWVGKDKTVQRWNIGEMPAGVSSISSGAIPGQTPAPVAPAPTPANPPVQTTQAASVPKPSQGSTTVSKGTPGQQAKSTYAESQGQHIDPLKTQPMAGEKQPLVPGGVRRR